MPFDGPIECSGTAMFCPPTTQIFYLYSSHPFFFFIFFFFVSLSLSPSLSTTCFSSDQVLKTPSRRIKDLCLLLSSLLIFYLLLHLPNPTLTPTSLLPTSPQTTPTTLHHHLFSIASSSLPLPTRSPFLRLWYSPNTTHAYLFLERPTPNPDPTLPPTLISLSTSRFPYSLPHGSRSAIRIVKESLARLNHTSHIRWFVYGDDDTLFCPG